MGKRFGRNEGQRHSMTHSERVASRGETAQINADNAKTPEQKQMHQEEADMYKRIMKDRQRSER